MTVNRKEPPKTTVEALEIHTVQNFLEVQAASKHDGTVHITSWLRGTDLSDPRSYNPLNPKEHRGIGARVSQEDLPALIEFLQDQVKPLPDLPTASGSVVEGRAGLVSYRRWVLLDSRQWLSTDNSRITAGYYALKDTKVLFDAGAGLTD